MRIVSLLPSATEIVCALGLGEQLVGITHECDWPPEVVGKPVLTRSAYSTARRSSREIHRLVRDAVHGGSSIYELDDEALAELKPDLILTQELCEVCAVSYDQVNEAARSIVGDVTVVSLEPTSLEGVFNTISTVGAMTAKESKAIRLLQRLRGRLGRFERKVQKRREQGHEAPRVVALEWFDPPFAVGHWVPERSTQTTWAALREVDPEMIVLMPCGFHLAETVDEWTRAPRPAWWKELEAVRRGNVFAVDGSAYFSRPGPRVIDGIAMLAEIFDPNAFIDTSPPGSWTPIES
jgi:iron complex transport system substrate-binding protein